MNNIEDAKKILKEYKHLIVRRNQLKKVIDTLEHDIQSAKGINFDNDASGGYNLPLSAKIARLADLKAKYEEIVEKIDAKIFEIEKLLMLVAEEQTLGANVLHYKFIEGKTIEEIGTIIGYAHRQTIRIYNSALRCFYIKFQEGENV